MCLARGGPRCAAGASTPSRCHSSPQARPVVTTRRQCSGRTALYAASAASQSTPTRSCPDRAWRPTCSASTQPSSIAMIAPCAMYCSGGCAASPSSATRPCTQFMIGSRSNIRHQRSRHISGRPFWICARAREGRVELVGCAPVVLAGQRLGRLEDGDLVEHLAAAQRVLHEVAAGPDVDDDVGLGDVVLAHLIERHGGAVGDVRRVDRLVADEGGAGDRVQAVGCDDDLGLLGGRPRR